MERIELYKISWSARGGKALVNHRYFADALAAADHRKFMNDQDRHTALEKYGCDASAAGFAAIVNKITLATKNDDR